MGNPKIKTSMSSQWLLDKGSTPDAMHISQKDFRNSGSELIPENQPQIAQEIQGSNGMESRIKNRI